MIPRSLIDAGVVCIVGLRGTGKTTLSKLIVEEFDRVIILDTMREYADVAVPCSLTDVGAWAWDGDRPAPRFSLAVELPDTNCFDAFCGVLRTLRDVLLVIDEVDQYVTVHDKPPYFRALVNYGRHYNQHLVTVSRRAAEVPRLLTSQAVLATFLQREPRDLEYISRLAQVDPSKLDLFEYYVCDGLSEEKHILPAP